MNEHEKQTKGDWEDSREAWRREDRRRPQAKGYAKGGDYGAAGAAGRCQATGSVQGAGSLPGGLDHRKNQGGKEMNPHSNLRAGDNVEHGMFGKGSVMPVISFRRGYVCVNFGMHGKWEVSADTLRFSWQNS